ncbi:2-amino-4-hydroxy-6-hydroxymethyldihydropteridine diphosphokinase [Kushneria phosphatilytica]|uniref:2-amino-4-hydroxy-6-hydroxymethyldihydropteridine pyrophosphokinase n=1 Tax=Kushneria phosphatilytica TaxID=657387 RepID=A0A1S1NQZ4_9GAMM|nr:2-amino-4-hydroxy-6-hydroxymethyldihydropteridine diphosphokinase [Kushneria phosphatilytica]OHV11244.1 2-amino-4-hydroxy-6-hydroxymethyldihydropteridine diphosphokinase [Kushneria phosphatilytica]QEL12180.1 2-amino-4-hydroxy-6-hydroxymethyldihydropteridine diphosphokinase [Kushneria phosphatilytica]
MAVFVGLGSNLDQPKVHIRQALAELATLPLVREFRASSLYSSRPVGPADQPDFINAVASFETDLSPLALLDQLQALEQRHRRVRQRHWGPRTLDLDLLLYHQHAIAHPRLTVPHPYLRERGFVLLPLAELAPSLELADGTSITALAAAHRHGDPRPLTDDD